jgi:hypothetical protein
MDIAISISCGFPEQDKTIMAKAVQHLWTLLSGTSFLPLELPTDDFSDMMEKRQWPIQCKLRYIGLSYCVGNIRFKIVACSLDLETIMFGGTGDVLSSHCHLQNE